MNRRIDHPFRWLGLVLAIGLLVALTLGRDTRQKAQADPPAVDAKAQIEQLQKDLKRVQELIPDQAAVMSHLSYHFTNLWFAADQENWPLADFYLSETRSNLKWAARAKPKRKDPDGKETVDIVAIAESVDNGPFTKLKQAIAAKDKKTFAKVYGETLSACYACHKASYKPYLRPQMPTQPETRVINFDAKATTPE